MRTSSPGLVLVLAAASALLFSAQASGHAGGLNAQGCHNNRKTGEYHCHRAQAVSSAGEILVKKSSSGICHSPESPYYHQTKNYTAFSSLSACLDSGGRLPR